MLGEEMDLDSETEGDTLAWQKICSQKVHSILPSTNPSLLLTHIQLKYYIILVQLHVCIYASAYVCVMHVACMCRCIGLCFCVHTYSCAVCACMCKYVCVCLYVCAYAAICYVCVMGTLSVCVCDCGYMVVLCVDACVTVCIPITTRIL